MRKLSKLLILTVVCIGAFGLELMAQKAAEPITAKNAVYLELGGNAGFYSLNYERLFLQKDLFKLGARIGIGAFPLQGADRSYWLGSIPMELTGLIGRTKHHLEVGVGYTSAIVPKFNTGPFEREFESYRYTPLVPFRLGYRYQKPDGGLLFRVAYTPLLDFTPERRTPLLPLFGGISVGKSF